jgi:hypothetical protein
MRAERERRSEPGPREFSLWLEVPDSLAIGLASGMTGGLFDEGGYFAARGGSLTFSILSNSTLRVSPPVFSTRRI